MMMSTKLPNEERPVDPQAQENIDRILHADAPKPPKKKRSDAGVPRKKPEPPTPATGKLSAADATEGLRLIQERDSKRAVWDTFEDHASKAHEEFDAADAAVLAWLRDHTA